MLIPELKDWNHGKGISIDSWISCVGNIELAIGFAHLFWPEFIVHNDCVFYKSRFTEESYKSWLESGFAENYGQIEATLNHTHIFNLFSNDKTESTTLEQVIYLGNQLCEIYKVKLKNDFPDRIFEVAFNGDEIYEELTDYELNFYQISNFERKI